MMFYIPQQYFQPILSFLLGTVILTPISTARAVINPELAVGIVQRFGNPKLTQLTLAATSGDRLTVRFKGESGDLSFQVPTIQLTTRLQNLSSPQIVERVVLSSHRSFESAEASATAWQSRGILTDIGQPGNWEVWADRQTYHTPLLRRLLISSFPSNQTSMPTLKTEVIHQIPQITWTLNGQDYSQPQLSITSQKKLIQVRSVSDGRPDRWVS